MSSVTKNQNRPAYIDIDSTYRDRRQFPNPCDFKAYTTEIRDFNKGISNANNILSDSYPYYQWQWGSQMADAQGKGKLSISNIINGTQIIHNKNEIKLLDDTYISTGILVNGAVSANSSDTVVNVDSVVATTMLEVGDVITRFDGTVYGTLKTLTSTSITFDGNENGLLTDTIDNDELYVRNNIVTNYTGFSINDYLAGLPIKLLQVRTTINHAAGYAVGVTDLAVVAPAPIALEVGQSLYKSDGKELGIITEVTSTTAIVIGAGISAKVVNGESVYVQVGSDRIKSYDTNTGIITLYNEHTATNSQTTINYAITNESNSSTIFIPGGSNQDGYYVGDIYECITYKSGAATEPTVHQFREITYYNGKTRMATLKSALSFFAGIENRSSTADQIYLNRIRKKIPLLPSGNSSANTSTNMPLLPDTSTVANSGGVYKVSIVNGGSGHSIGNIVNCGSNNTKVTVNVVSGGVVTSVTVSRAGSGASPGDILTQTGTTGSGSGLQIQVIGVGTAVTVTGAEGIGTENGKYNGKILYYPGFLGGGTNDYTEPSAAQSFIPQNNTLNIDSKNSYDDTKHCSFEILAHTYDTSVSELVIKSLSSTDVAKFIKKKEFNILDFKEDGVKEIKNNFHYLDNINLFEIHLLELTLPNIKIKNGGNIVYQRYVLVEIYSDSYDSVNIYNTNNPNLESVTFKCAIVDTAGISNIKPFLTLKGIAPIVTNFNLNDNVNMRIMLPNGEVLKHVISDNVPPILPNKELQITANLMLKPIIN